MRQVWFQNKRSKERRLKQLTSMGLRPYFGASRKLRGFPVSPGLDDGSGVGVGVGGFNPYFDPKYAAEFSYGGGPGPHPGHPFNLHPGHPGHPGLGPHPHPNGVPFGDFFGPPPPPPQGGAQPNGPGAPSGGPQGPQGNAPFGATGGMGNGMDPSSMGPADFGQLGDPTQFLSSNDLISQRSSPDFMPGGPGNFSEHQQMNEGLVW